MPVRIFLSVSRECSTLTCQHSPVVFKRLIVPYCLGKGASLPGQEAVELQDNGSVRLTNPHQVI